ncbi:MAG: tandem-95 repeat protein, partial [Acidiferrobacteraceae bacterium]|nr:tandem-95 repeat protein [Acidiferrobacteraceae bacterium]
TLANLGNLIYTGASNYNGADTFTYTVQDAALSSSTGTMALTVAAVDDAPIFTSWTATITEDTAYTLSTSLFGYSDADSDALVNIRTMFGFNGCPNGANSGSATPTVWEDTDGDGTVNGNEATIGYGVNIAVAKFDAGDMKYLPPTNTNGNAATYLCWQAHNANAYSADTYSTTFNINAVNDAPANAGDAAGPSEDVAYSSWTAATDWGYTDVDSDTMVSITLVSLPSQGTLTEASSACGGDGCAVNDVILLANLGNLIYTGASNYNGADSFTYTVEDAALSSSTGTMTLTVAAVNDAPVNTLGSASAVNEDTANAITGSSIADAEDSSMTSVVITADRGTFTLTTSSATYDVGTQGTAASTVTISGTVTNINVAIATITWTSAADDSTNAVITVVTTDSSGGADTDTISITVNAVNDTPANAGDTAGPSEDVAYSSWTAATDWGYTDVDSDTMVSITLKSLPSQGTLTEASSACGGDGCAIDDVILLANLGNLIYTGASNYNGADSFTYTVEDAALSSSTGTMALTVAAVDDVPVCDAGDAETVTEGATVTLDGTGSTDTESATITYAWSVSSGTSQTLNSASAAGPTFTAAQGTASYTTTLSLTCTASGADGTASTVVISVTADNDAPTVASVISDASTAEDAAYSLNIASNFADVDDAMTFTISGAPSTITASTAGVISGTPVNANVGAHSIVVTATDAGGSNTVSDTYVLTVTNVNDAPTVTSAISDVSTAEDAAYLLNAASTCTDVDADDTLSYTISGAPSTITATTAGVISGTPVNADVGAHTITVTCTDDSSAATSATVQYVLTVTNVNDAPTFTSTADTTAPEDVAYAYIVTATDTEGEAITLTGTTIPSWASFVDLGSGSGVLSGTPTNSDVTSGFEVTLTATDASNAAGTQVFDIVV